MTMIRRVRCDRRSSLDPQLWPLSVLVVNGVGVLCVLVFVFGRTIVLDGNLMVPVAISVGVLIPLVPVAALAWIEPDPLPQGE